MTRTAAIYARISRDRNGDQLGVKRQRDDCRKLIEVRDWLLVGEYIDDDRSAYSGKRRPEYERLLADLEAGTVDLRNLGPDSPHQIGIAEGHRNTSGDVVTSDDIPIAPPRSGSPPIWGSHHPQERPV